MIVGSSHHPAVWFRLSSSVFIPLVYHTDSIHNESEDKPHRQTNPPEIQACQTARTPDWHCWSMDLAQIEMRVPGLLSGDPKLIAAFESGLDLHTDKALSIFGQSFLEQKLNLAPGTPIDKSTPGFNDYRQVGKTDNFASQFWATAPTMQKTVFEDQMIYVPIDFFKKAVKSRPTSMPTFYQWQCHTTGSEQIRRWPICIQFFARVDLCNKELSAGRSVKLHKSASTNPSGIRTPRYWFV